MGRDPISARAWVTLGVNTLIWALGPKLGPNWRLRDGTSREDNRKVGAKIARKA